MATDGSRRDFIKLGAAVAAVGASLPGTQAQARNVYAVGWNYLEHFAEGQALRAPDKRVE